MNFAKYIKYILILFIVFLIFLIYRILFNEKEILILTSNEPIKEQPIDAPEMKQLCQRTFPFLRYRRTYSYFIIRLLNLEHKKTPQKRCLVVS